MTKTSKVVDATPQEGNLVRVATPKNISLVGSPANSQPFKILRSDQGTKMTKSKQPVKARQPLKRSVPSPVLELSFPEGTTEVSVNATLESFGMLTTHTVTQDGAGIFTARRSDLKSIAQDSIPITLTEEGIVARIDRSAAKNEAAAQETGVEPSGLALYSIDIDYAKITRADAEKWISDNSIDISLGDEENPLSSVLLRSDDAGDAEVRNIEIATGITLGITRAEMNELPEGVYCVVNEAAYGRWGWGMLDFSARVADEAYSDKMRTGIDALEGVLREISLYSELPMDARKELVTRALTDFGTFAHGWMDTLPRQLLAQIARSDKTPSQLENSMKTNEAETAVTQAAPATPEVLTRADVQEMISAAVAAALSASTVQRSDAAAAPAEAEAAVSQTVTRSDLTAALAEALAPMQLAITALGSTTVLHRNDADAGQKITEEAKAEAERIKRSDPFRGAIPGIGARS